MTRNRDSFVRAVAGFLVWCGNHVLRPWLPMPFLCFTNAAGMAEAFWPCVPKWKQKPNVKYRINPYEPMEVMVPASERINAEAAAQAALLPTGGKTSQCTEARDADPCGPSGYSFCSTLVCRSRAMGRNSSARFVSTGKLVTA